MKANTNIAVNQVHPLKGMLTSDCERFVHNDGVYHHGVVKLRVRVNVMVMPIIESIRVHIASQ